MDGSVKAFIKASVGWLTLGVTLSAAMAVRSQWSVYRPAHLHMLTLGFVAMMIFRVGYHVIPRIVGHPLISQRLPLVHWWASNVGLSRCWPAGSSCVCTCMRWVRPCWRPAEYYPR